MSPGSMTRPEVSALARACSTNTGEDRLHPNHGNVAQGAQQTGQIEDGVREDTQIHQRRFQMQLTLTEQNHYQQASQKQSQVKY